METQQNQVALPMRAHTILGVCEAIGEDFGFFAFGFLPQRAVAAFFLDSD